MYNIDNKKYKTYKYTEYNLIYIQITLYIDIIYYIKKIIYMYIYCIIYTNLILYIIYIIYLYVQYIIYNIYTTLYIVYTT